MLTKIIADSQIKVVFGGPVGAGKTTSLHTVSDSEPVTTDARTIENIGKEHTTVAMDYGTLLLENGTKLHLYAAPGQERFSYMWNILGRGSSGLVLLIDQSRPNPIDELHFFLTEFRKVLKHEPIVIGLTKRDVAERSWKNAAVEHLRELDLKYPVFELDAREKNRVRELILCLLLQIQSVQQAVSFKESGNEQA